jgi:hypothetical protein
MDYSRVCDPTKAAYFYTGGKTLSPEDEESD